MIKAYLNSIAYYLPQTILSNEELVAEFPEWTVEKIADKVGVNQRHVVAPDETALDMATLAAQKLFNQESVNKEKIDFILFCTQSGEYKLPTTACLLQERLGLSTNVGALDFNLGCSGYVYGLSLAKGLIASGVAKNVLLITAETYSKYLHKKDKGNRTIFGDAATASLISINGDLEIAEFSLGTDGRGANNLIVETGASRCPDKKNDLTFDENGNPHSADYLFMNGAEIFNFTLDAVPPLVKDTLAKNNLQKEEIDLFVFHQANKYMINFLRKKLKIEDEKFFVYLENVGNTVSSTIPIALCEARKENKVKGNVLLAGFGVGYSWGGVILKGSK